MTMNLIYLEPLKAVHLLSLALILAPLEEHSKADWQTHINKKPGEEN